MAARPPEILEAPGPSSDSDAWVEAQVEAMAESWRRGERRTAETVLAARPSISHQAAVRLIYEEVCLRRESGEEVDTAEVVRRFPRWQSELKALIRCDRLMRPPVAVDFPAVGESLGDFRLLGELGRGTSGRTFLAAQPSLADRPVVLKVAPREHDEHLSLARLQHTHIVPLYSEQVFPDRGLRALCMPFLGGANLAQLLSAMADVPAERRRGRDLLRALDRSRSAADPLPASGPFREFLGGTTYVRAICWIAACLADALQYAHDRGLVHMDVKPSNVLVSADGQPMLLDFHLAQGPIRPGEGRPDRLGGTPGWMSPEQKSAMRAVVDGRDVDRAVDGRSDLYSLGLLLYEALGGGASAPDGPAARPRLDRINPGVSVGLADLVQRCLSDDPRARYRDAASLAEDLRRHLNDLPLRGVPNRSPIERWRKWRRRSPHALARQSARLTTAVAIAAMAVLGWAFYRQRVRVIESALGDARRLRSDRQYSEAIRSADRGLELAGRTPAAGGLARSLDEQRRLALRGSKARELHDLADLIRFRYGLAPAATDEARALVRRCRRIWDDRALLLPPAGDGLDPETERQVRSDLLELAIIGADLRVRLAPPGELDEARREALRLLDEADASFGPSLALARDRRALASALGLPEAGGAPDPVPRSAWDHYDLGRSHLRTGQIAQAAEQFGRTLDLRPQDFWPNFYQGLCSYRLRRYEEALAAFRACVTLSPDRAECYFNRALAHDALGHLDRAAKDYTRALELDGGLAVASLNRGILSYKAGRPADAIADFRRALDGTPGRDLSGQIQYNLALAHLALGDRRSALACAGAAKRLGEPAAPALLDRIHSSR